MTLRDNFIAPNAHINKEKLSKLIASASTLIKIKQEHIKYNIRRIKEIIKIWALKYKTKKVRKISMKSKAGSLRISVKLITSGQIDQEKRDNFLISEWGDDHYIFCDFENNKTIWQVTLCQ